MSASQGVEQLARLDDLLSRDARFEVVQQGIGDAESDIGPEQRFLEIVPGLVGDRRATEHAGDHAA